MYRKIDISTSFSQENPYALVKVFQAGMAFADLTLGEVVELNSGAETKQAIVLGLMCGNLIQLLDWGVIDEETYGLGADKTEIYTYILCVLCPTDTEYAEEIVQN